MRKKLGVSRCKRLGLSGHARERVGCHSVVGGATPRAAARHYSPFLSRRSFDLLEAKASKDDVLVVTFLPFLKQSDLAIDKLGCVEDGENLCF